MNRKQRIMQASGLPRAYQRPDLTLASIPGHEALEEYAAGIIPLLKAREEVLPDTPPPFFCGPRGDHALYLFARKLLLQEVPVKIYALSDIFDLLREGEQDGAEYTWQEWHEKAVVFILGVFDGMPVLPGPQEEINRVQWFLHRLDQGSKLALFHSVRNPDGDVRPPWWSPCFTSHIMRSTFNFTLA